MAKKELLQPRNEMREELESISGHWPDLEQAAGVPAGTIKKFVESDDITDKNLHKLDAVNRM